jgi:tRNA-splicing ligase RtcB
MAEEGAPVGKEYKGAINPSIVRTYEEELKYIRRVSPCKFEIAKGFVHGMNVGGTFYVNEALEDLLMDELKSSCSSAGYGGFLPAVKQIANVAALPGIVKRLEF